MTNSVKRRSYHSRIREEAAKQTRQAVLKAARDLFLRKGYGATTMSAVAARAGVSLDTVYATAGKKPDLFLLLLESAISGGDDAINAEDRAYVKAIRAERTARKKLEIYAGAVGEIARRLAPLHAVLRAAAHTDADLAAIWRRISSRRAANMHVFARDLMDTGQLRCELSVERVADVIWSMNGPEYYTLLVLERGWSVSEFSAWLYEAWVRLLL